MCPNYLSRKVYFDYSSLTTTTVRISGLDDFAPLSPSLNLLQPLKLECAGKITILFKGNGTF